MKHPNTRCQFPHNHLVKTDLLYGLSIDRVDVFAVDEQSGVHGNLAFEQRTFVAFCVCGGHGDFLGVRRLPSSLFICD